MQPSSNGAARPAPITVGIGGFGAIGRKVARRLDDGIPGLALAAVSARRLDAASAEVSGFCNPVPVVPLSDLAGVADVIVECAPAEAFRDVAVPALTRSKTLVVISVGALIGNPDIEALARDHNARIVVPTGALLGLDAVKAASEGEIRSVRMISRKPPRGLSGAPYLVEHGIDVEGLHEPRKVFQGTAREAVKGFPANVNVAAALSLAGIGADRTLIEIWAVPGLDRNNHTIEVEADSASFTMTINNVPSENPKTGKITALSIIAALRKLASTIQVGT